MKTYDCIFLDRDGTIQNVGAKSNYLFLFMFICKVQNLMTNNSSVKKKSKQNYNKKYNQNKDAVIV